LHDNRDSFKSVGGETDATLLRYFFESGLRPFIFDGIKKAQAGLISFDQTIQNCPSLSSDFQKIGANSGLGISASWQEYSSKVIDRQQQGFAPGTPGQVSGRIENEHSLKQDGPLFSVGRSGKVRSMPLLLVVEDDLDQRQILELVFSSAGYNVTLADNGEEAWKQVESEMPDLIVTDLMMPVMDGVTFLRQLKADSRFKAIPVLVLTVVSDVDKEYELLTAGADDYCEKSVQRKILLRRIENLLRRTGVSVSK
jgi:CheY-like chemotaxis protein